MITSYASVLDIDPPERFDRPQVFLRILILFALGVLGTPLGAILGIVYLLVPLVAAMQISARGGERYLTDFAPRYAAALHYLFDGLGYLMFLTDLIPSRHNHAVRFSVHPSGAPTVSSALWRLLFSIPEALVLMLLGIVSGMLWVVSAVLILFTGRYPAAIYGFQRGLLRAFARMLAYHASFVDRYPPFALETGSEATQG
jgi:hypothetical protein